MRPVPYTVGPWLSVRQFGRHGEINSPLVKGPMKRPISITLISWLFIVGNGIMLLAGWMPPAQRLVELEQNPIESGAVHAVRILGIICGAFILRGGNWARWLAVAWLAFHVGISAFSPEKQAVVMHSILMALIVFLLFRPPANAYFRNAKTIPARNTNAT